MNTSKAIDNISHRPGWQVTRALRRAGWTQARIAQGAGCNQSDVSKVIHRRIVGTKLAGRVWAEIARVINGGAQ